MYTALLEDAALLEGFGEQDMSQFMWAASYLEQPPPPALMDGIAQVALNKLDAFTGVLPVHLIFSCEWQSLNTPVTQR